MRRIIQLIVGSLGIGLAVGCSDNGPSTSNQSFSGVWSGGIADLGSTDSLLLVTAETATGVAAIGSSTLSGYDLIGTGGTSGAHITVPLYAMTDFATPTLVLILNLDLHDRDLRGTARRDGTDYSIVLTRTPTLPSEIVGRWTLVDESSAAAVDTLVFNADGYAEWFRERSSNCFFSHPGAARRDGDWLRVRWFPGPASSNSCGAATNDALRISGDTLIRTAAERYLRRK